MWAPDAQEIAKGREQLRRIRELLLLQQAVLDGSVSEAELSEQVGRIISGS